MTDTNVTVPEPTPLIRQTNDPVPRIDYHHEHENCSVSPCEHCTNGALIVLNFIKNGSIKASELEIAKLEQQLSASIYYTAP